MKLATVTGTVTATAKVESLVGQKLLLLNIIDGKGKVLAPACVAVDSCGAGVGDTVLVTSGSAARMLAGLGTVPVDLTIVAVVDRVELS